jgi:hypothetical protein
MKRFLPLVAAAGLTLMASAAQAIPALQLYIDGATYDSVNETWVVSSNSFDLWVLGDVGHSGAIYGVNLVGSGYGSGTVSITPTTTANPIAGADPSTPSAPVDYGLMSTSQALTFFAGTAITQGVTTHDEYANADDHHFWGIGDFTLQDSKIGDFSYGVPSSFPDDGQINVYHVDITGYDAVHFDAFDHVVAGEKITYVKAPFSHDATDAVPEPGTLALLGIGIVGAVARKRLNKTA